MDFKNIYLVRHGKIGSDIKGKSYIGQSDIPLNDEGREQAEKLGRRLNDINITNIFSSDLIRSVETAEIIAAHHHLSPVIIPSIKEISMGEWEGMTFAEIMKRWPDEYKKRGDDILNYRTPGGESFADLRERVIPAFQKIAESASGDIVITGHAGVNRILLCHILGLPYEKMFNIPQDYGCINRIFAGISNFRVVLMNDTGKL